MLYDFGGVFTASPFGAVESAASEVGADPGQLSQIMFGLYHEDTDHPWHRLERGEISLLDARERVLALAREAGFDIDPFALLRRTVAGPGLRDPLVAQVRRLRAEGYQTALVTNNVREFSAAWRSLIPVAELFDLIVDSSDVGMRKPNPEIYRHALRELGGVAPQRAVFLDDYAANVEAAVKLGLHGVLVEPEFERAILALDRLLAGQDADAGGDTKA